MRSPFRRAATLPLGIDLGLERVAVVACETVAGELVVRDAHSTEVPTGDPATIDLTIAEALRSIVSRVSVPERRCVIAAPPADVVSRVFRVPPGMRRPEAERAATLEADSIVDWPSTERLVALDPIPERTGEMLLSIARHSTIVRLVAIARAAGCKAVAVDVAACAWRRAIRDADAVLDCTGDRASLVIFGEPIGMPHLFAPRLIDERLATNIRAALVQARRDGFADVQRLAILGTPYRYESLEALLRDDGYAVTQVVLGENVSPPWAFAYGLATWSVAERGLIES